MTNVKAPIGRRLIRNIIIVSTFFSIIATAIQLYSDYKEEKELLNIRLEQVRASALKSMTLNLWQDNEQLIRVQLESLLSFHDVSYAAVIRKDRENIFYGEDHGKDTVEKVYPMTHIYNDKEYALGTLVLKADLAQLRDRLKEKFYLIALTQSIKTFIVAFIMLYIFSHMVTRHLFKMAEFANEVMHRTDDPSVALKLNVKDDELKFLADSLNQMQQAVHSKLQSSQAQKQELLKSNEALKERLSKQESGDILCVFPEDREEIERMLKLMQDSPSRTYTLEEMRNDLGVLNILIQRAFRRGKL